MFSAAFFRFLIPFLLTGYVLIMPNNLSAQKLEIALRFQPTIASFELSKADGSHLNSQSKTGYGIAAMMAHNFSSHVGLQEEMIYSSVSRTYNEAGLVKEITGRKRGKIFSYHEYMNIMNEGTGLP